MQQQQHNRALPTHMWHACDGCGCRELTRSQCLVYRGKQKRVADASNGYPARRRGSVPGGRAPNTAQRAGNPDAAVRGEDVTAQGLVGAAYMEEATDAEARQGWGEEGGDGAADGTGGAHGKQRRARGRRKRAGSATSAARKARRGSVASVGKKAGGGAEGGLQLGLNYEAMMPHQTPEVRSSVGGVTWLGGVCAGLTPAIHLCFPRTP